MVCAVKHRPFQTRPQLMKRGEDGTKRAPFVMRQQARYVLQQKICRLSGFSQSGNFKEQGSPVIVEASALSAEAVGLARKAGTEQIKVRHSSGVNFSGVWIINLLLSDGVDGAVAGVGVFVDFAVANALETARTGQSGPEAADAREHIKIADQLFFTSIILQCGQKTEDVVPDIPGLLQLLWFSFC